MPHALSIRSGISQIHSHHLRACKTAQQINYQMPWMLPGWLTVGPECHFDPKCCSIKQIGGLHPITSPLLLQASSPIFQEVHSSLSDILSSVFEHFHVFHRLLYLWMRVNTCGHCTDFWPKIGGKSICDVPHEINPVSKPWHNIYRYTFLRKHRHWWQYQINLHPSSWCHWWFWQWTYETSKGILFSAVDFLSRFFIAWEIKYIKPPKYLAR